MPHKCYECISFVRSGKNSRKAMRKIIKQILYSNSVLHGELVTAWDVHAVRKRNMQNL